MRTLGLADPAFVAATAIAPSGYDTDAAAYITAVETADGQALETAVADAINAFVVGCKADGIWDAIKASCIMAGARTLNGALVPLVGAAPTNFNFVAGDYNRKTGLVGNGSTKYLRTSSVLYVSSNTHISAYQSSLPSSGARVLIGITSPFFRILRFDVVNAYRFNSGVNSIATPISGFSAGFFAGMHQGAQALMRRNSDNISTSETISTTTDQPFYVFAQNQAGSATAFSDGRIAFYSIGESLDLALLDARVTTLINAFAAAIP